MISGKGNFKLNVKKKIPDCAATMKSIMNISQNI